MLCGSVGSRAVGAATVADTARRNPLLLLEDPGGEPLARLLGRPMELTQSLDGADSPPAM